MRVNCSTVRIAASLGNLTKWKQFFCCSCYQSIFQFALGEMLKPYTPMIMYTNLVCVNCCILKSFSFYSWFQAFFIRLDMFSWLKITEWCLIAGLSIRGSEFSDEGNIVGKNSIWNAFFSNQISTKQYLKHPRYRCFRSLIWNELSELIGILYSVTFPPRQILSAPEIFRQVRFCVINKLRRLNKESM